MASEAGGDAPALGAARRRAGRPAALSRLRALDLKARGDECVRARNYRSAWEAYTKCLALGRDALRGAADRGAAAGAPPELEVAIRSNRSLAYVKANRYKEALEDADFVVDARPAWEKGHFRRGAALAGLRRSLDAFDAFVDAFAALSAATGGSSGERSSSEVETALWDATKKLTREELATRIVEWIQDAEDEGTIEPPELEAVSKAEMVEALFRQMHEDHRDRPFPQKYYHEVLRWAKRGMAPKEMYCERSVCHTRARAFRQGALDADLAMAAAGARGVQWADAWFRKGEAHAADHQHPDQDWAEAVKAYTRAVDLDPDNATFQEQLRFAGGNLGADKMTAVLNECYAGMGEAKRAAAGGILEELRATAVSRVEAMCCFTAAKAKDFTAKARDGFRACLAARAGVPKLKVVIERVKPVRPVGLDVHFTVVMEEPGQGQAQALLDALTGADGSDGLAGLLASHEGPNAALVAKLAADMEDEVLGRVVDATPEAPPAVQQPEAVDRPPEPRKLDGSRERSLYMPVRPKLDMELPYRMYKLVRFDGAAVERQDRFAFQMSRVYNRASELKERTYVEIMDGSLRWTQSGSEIQIIVLGVPEGVRAAALEVSIDSRELRIAHKETGEVYVEGRLWRAVVPEDCTWTINDADEPGAITMYLCKMNLELLAEYWELSHSWWEKLFTHHAGIQWDDYDKDYSDIPTEVREHHARQEAKSEEVRRIERSDEHLREKECEREDVRKREKFLRLERLGAGHWSYVHYDPLAPLYDGRTDKQRKPVWLPGAPPGEGGGEYNSPTSCPSDRSFIVNATDYQATNVSKMFEAFEIKDDDQAEFARARLNVEATYRFSLDDEEQTAVTGAHGHKDADQMYEEHVEEAEAFMAGRGLESKALKKAREHIDRKKAEKARATVGGVHGAFDEDGGAETDDGAVYEVDDDGDRVVDGVA